MVSCETLNMETVGVDTVVGNANLTQCEDSINNRVGSNVNNSPVIGLHVNGTNMVNTVTEDNNNDPVIGSELADISKNNTNSVDWNDVTCPEDNNQWTLYPLNLEGGNDD